MNTTKNTTYKIKDIQYGSLSVCKDIEICPQSLIVKPDENNANQWSEIPLDNNHYDSSSAANNIFQANAIIHSIVPFAQIKRGTCIRIPPMKWHCGGWDPQHFHDQLRIPILPGNATTTHTTTSSAASRGIVVTLEAMARECVAVALSPRPYFDLGKTYVVHFGAASNLQTVIRRRLGNPKETVDVTLSSPQICTSDRFQAYWIILQNKGQLSVGVGKIPGKNCIGSLDDSVYHEIRSGVDAVKYVGLGNSALGRRAKDVKVRNVRVMSVPDAFVAFGGIPLTMYKGGDYGDGEYFGNCVDDDDDDPKVADTDAADLWMEYSKECEKARKRAAKFGIEYKQPQPDAFFSWSEARKMRANPERGFITGFDIMDEKEVEKQRKRKERFFGQDPMTSLDEDGNGGGGGGDDDGDFDGQEDDHDKDDNVMAEQNVNKKGGGARLIAIHEAWDNEELVGGMRVDPPECLWNKATTTMMMEDNHNDPKQDSIMTMMMNNDVRYVPTKIHLFAIDWAAFKQIRSDDILSYFKVYGPTYVEWLGELSCNIHFEDKFSASRALEALSRALPMEIPLSSSSCSSSNGTMEVNEMDKTVDDTVENAESCNATTAPHDEEEEEAKAISNTNLGRMGWRLCNRPIYKIRSDKYGRRGTRSRCIVRMATSLDVLEERPSSFPKPPPGFTTHRVLGPGSDYRTYSRRPRTGNRYDRPRGRQDKRRRRQRSASDDVMNHSVVDDFDQSAIDRALTAPRR